ncbi:MAG: hypothetical protein U0172_06465 [Nitrospiraceae bacterium]
MSLRRLQRFAVGALSLSLLACQSTEHPNVAAQSSAHPFDRLWASYLHCVNATDVNDAHAHALVLEQAAAHEEDYSTFLPSTLNRYVTKPPSRLAADPRALATACRDHVDRIARSQSAY